MRSTKGVAKNRNARRSINLLEQAFTELLAEKPYDKITVSDIARKADLNRGTFYAHFDSVEDLMRQTMDDFTEKLAASLGPALDTSFFEDPMPVLSQVGDFLTENRATVHTLANSGWLEPLFSALFRRVTDVLHERAEKRAEKDVASDQRLAVKMVDFVLGGVIDVYDAWLSGTYGTQDVDQVNQDLCRLIRAAGKAMPQPQAGMALSS